MKNNVIQFTEKEQQEHLKGNHLINCPCVPKKELSKSQLNNYLENFNPNSSKYEIRE